VGAIASTNNQIFNLNLRGVDLVFFHMKMQIPFQRDGLQDSPPMIIAGAWLAKAAITSRVKIPVTVNIR
jgi:hypothetical protein